MATPPKHRITHLHRALPSNTALIRQMSKITHRERKTQYFALLIALTGCCVVALVLFTIGLYYRPYYFLAHFMLGLVVPFFFYSMGGIRLTFWLGITLTSIFHFGYEFWEDQLTRIYYTPDWDQIISGALGLFSSYIIYHLWNKKLDKEYHQ